MNSKPNPDYCIFAHRMCEDANITAMPRKLKKKIFSAAKIVREMARERVGSPRPSSLVPGKKKNAEKHKPTLGKLLADD
jgi:hypothetical protein